MVIESKDDMKARIGFSPDIADALCLTFDRRLQWQTQRVTLWDEIKQHNDQNDYDPLGRRANA
jgi:hypothetical protein